MAAYRYRALGVLGVVSGDVEAESQVAAAAGLQKRGLTVLRVERRRGWAGLGDGVLGGGGRIRASELPDITRELASMLGAGQDIDRALRYMVEGAASQRVAAVLGRVRDAVRNGAPLAVAMGRETGSFPKLYLGLVKAGEAGGQLAPALERLGEMLERGRQLTATVQSAMIYPAILVVAAVGSIVMLLTQVLPQFVPLFAQNGVALPASTAFLLAMGGAISAFGVYGLGATVLAGWGVRVLLRRPVVRAVVDRALLRLPVAGGLLAAVEAARFSRSFGTLLMNGVPLLAALGTVQDVLGNVATRGAVAAAAGAVKAGQGMARSLEASAVFPPRMVQLMRLGEDTARLGPMALRSADIFDEKVRQGVERVVALLVPAITILMGAAVAGIVSSLLLAMLSLNDIAQ